MPHKNAKRTKEIRSSIDKDKAYVLDEAVKLVKSAATAKFDESIEVAVNLGVDPKQSDQQVRGAVAMPKGLGKDVKVAVFARGDKAKEAGDAGAEHVGAEDLAEKIEAGKVEFDRCIATPDMMGVVGKLGKVLGPRGLMPNPKLGTVTPDVKKAVEESKAGQVEFRLEKAGVVHAAVGKASFKEGDIAENITAFIEALNKAKPSGVKGTYMKKVSISSTMGVGVAVDHNQLLAA